MRKIVSSLVCLWLSAPALGQNTPTVENTEPNYVDRVIAPDQLPNLVDEDDGTPIDISGPPRGWLLELGAGITTNDVSTQHQVGLSAAGYLETANYGAWSFDVDANRNNDNEIVIGRLTVFQRGLALDNGWRMDNSLGTLGNPMPALLRQQYRFVLPTLNFLGVSSEVRHADGRILNAALGRSGRRTDGRFSNFDTDGGNVMVVGGQTQSGPLQAAATVISSQLIDGNSQASALVAANWTKGSNAFQANVLTDHGNGTGVWIDAISKPNSVEHRYGIFRFDPSLEWAGQVLQSDVQGFYYRASSRQTRWVWSGGLDQVQSLSGTTPDSTYFTAQGRYQLTSRWGFGGAASAKVFSGATTTSVQAFVDQKTVGGTARLQIDQARSDELRSEQISWDQSFANAGSSQWAAKLSFLQQHDRNDRSGQEWAASIYGSHELSSRMRWNGLIQAVSGQGELAQSGLEANLGLNWAINRSLSLSATYNQSYGRRASLFDLAPLAVPDPELKKNDKSFFFTLRYEHRAGRAVGVIGGAVGSGAGDIVGEIYLDANADGLRNADEVPVRDIVVLLDGRYQARTDINGRFSFDRVAAGKHTLIAVSDNLPLPWQLPSEPKIVEVKVRDTLRFSLGALQPTK